MSLRPLVIDVAAKERAAKIRAHAEAHHYIPGPGVPPPGDDHRFVGHFNSYRCCFSITHSDNMIWRHFSCSVPGTKYPNPFACYELATLFGFTGWDGKSEDLPSGWMGTVDDGAGVRCVVLVQSLARDTRAAH